MVALVTDELPPIRRPGAVSDRRRLVEAALSDGQVRTGVARTKRAARDEVKRLRWHAHVLGVSLTARYEDRNDGTSKWHVLISTKGQQ